MSATGWLTGADSVQLSGISITATTGEKPQSKLWEYEGQWFSVLPDSSGTWVRRLDGSTWTSILRLTPDTRVQADVKQDGNLAHVLLFDGVKSQLATIEYVPGTQPSWQLWSVQPKLVDVVLSAGVETATIDIDGAGTLWLASDALTSIEVRHSEYPYTAFSRPITLANGVSRDDISDIAELPDGSVGVLWSDQVRRQFGFRIHAAAADPASWSRNEMPAAQSAKRVGHGMADDHLHIAVASDGTLYAAVKTSYDTAGQTTIGLLVRRPNGVWDGMYTVDTKGTRPIIVLNEQANRLAVIYTKATGGGDIVFRESPLGTISLGPRTTLIAGNLNNVSSAKQVTGDDLVIIATQGNRAVGVHLFTHGMTPATTASIQQTSNDSGEGEGSASGVVVDQAASRDALTASRVLLLRNGKAGGLPWIHVLMVSKPRRP
jgi:hypothetical protein